MSCYQYILTDDEITTICANYLVIDNATTDLHCLLGEEFSKVHTLKGDVGSRLARLDTALNNLRPLTTHLFELQGRDIWEEK